MPHKNMKTKATASSNIYPVGAAHCAAPTKRERLCAAIFSSVIARSSRLLDATKQSRIKNEIASPAFGGFAMTTLIAFLSLFLYMSATATAGDAELKKGRLELNPDGGGTIRIGMTRIRIGNSNGYLVSGKDEKLGMEVFC